MKPAEATMTMQQIADAAQVSRPAVNNWRKRGTDPSHGLRPFPDPVDGGPHPRFRLEEVQNWFRADKDEGLDQVRAGNNPEVVADAPLHSSLMVDLVEHPGPASALLVAASLLQSPLEEIASAPQQLLEGLAAVPGATEYLPEEDLLEALQNQELVHTVDVVVDAAYDAVRVLSHLHRAVLAREASSSTEGVSSALQTVIGAVLREVVDSFRLSSSGVERFAAVPRKAGAVHLLAQLVAPESPDAPEAAWAPGHVGVTPTHLASELVAWRLLLARFQGLERVDPMLSAAEALPYLQLGSWLSPGHQERSEFFAWVGDLIDDLPMDGAALVLGPAELMLDELDKKTAACRQRLLRGAEPAGKKRSRTLLRWAAALPDRLMGHGGRRSLALWLFTGASVEGDTIFSVYHDVRQEGVVSALASDAAAAVRGRDAMESRDFASGNLVDWEQFFQQGVLRQSVVPKRSAADRVGEIIARALGAAEQSGLDFPEGHWPSVAPGAVEARREHRVKTRPWRVVESPQNRNQRLARKLEGHRIPADLVKTEAVNGLRIVGIPELREPHRLEKVSARRLDRIDAMHAFRRLQETQPGDVVFTESRPPMAWVDREGGNVVEAPAKVLRLRPRGEENLDVRVWGESQEGPSETLVPDAVAADIRAQKVAGTDPWHLRVFPKERSQAVAEFAEAAAARRRVLLKQLRLVEQAEAAVYDGVAAGLVELAGQRPTHGPGARGGAGHQES